MKTTLPPAIKAYIEASNSYDVEALVSHYKPDAVVEDEGQTHQGIGAIRDWIEKTHVEYSFTLEPLDCSEDGEEIVVTCEVTGTFPGSPITLHFAFTMEGDRIAALSIRD